MTQLRIFVSHNNADNVFCRAVVEALGTASADVWYDEHNMGAGRLLKVVQHELASRPIFLVMLSKAAFASQWVEQESHWAFNLYHRQPDRVILPITAQPIEPSDFNTWLFLEDFKRIEAPGYQPLPLPQAISETLQALVLTPPSANVAPSDPKSTGKSVLWVDDNPSNTFYERRSLQRHGITFTLSTSTDDALGKLIRNHFDAIISDMGRPPDKLAGYTLLEWARKVNPTVPLILYCPTRPEHVEESVRRGAAGQTSSLSELFRLLQEALRLH